jgi:hypothetical protein
MTSSSAFSSIYFKIYNILLVSKAASENRDMIDSWKHYRVTSDSSSMCKQNPDHLNETLGVKIGNMLGN